MWKCNLYVEMYVMVEMLVKAEMQVKLQRKQSDCGKIRSQQKWLSLLWKIRRQDRNLILSGNVSHSRSVRQSGNASHIDWEQKMPTNGGKLGKGGLRCKCRWGKAERKIEKWHGIDIHVHVHKQESVMHPDHIWRKKFQDFFDFPF